MGLAQKRISQEFQTTVFPGWKKAFDTVLGFDMPMEVKWETMTSDDYQDRDQYFEWYNKVYFEPLMTVFTNICRDEMGKTAVREMVKKITIDGTEGHYGTHSKFENGTFMLKHKFNTNVDQAADRVKEWTDMIEKAL